MENIDSLKPGDEVTVTIWGPDNSSLYQSTGNGYHNLATAVKETIDKANLQINPEDCVFEIANRNSGVAHRYRLNAHGHLKLII